MICNQAFAVSSPPRSSCILFKGGTRKIRATSDQRKRFYTKWVSGCNFQNLSANAIEWHYLKKSSVHHRLQKYCIPAASEKACIPEPNLEKSDDLWVAISKKLGAFYEFSRPHTIIGTIVGITSVSLLPLENIADLSPMFFIGLLKTLFPAVFMNIYVVGLNQLFDVEIDKINKPNLPLASGEFSMKTGVAIVTAFLVMSFAMGLKSQSPPLLSALIISFLLGSAYSVSLPFLRWKQNAFLAASCIMCVRAILVQLAFFVHMQRYVLRRPMVLTKSVVFATAFMCFFSAVIALFKVRAYVVPILPCGSAVYYVNVPFLRSQDIPDVDGDKDFGIQSFSVRLGPKKVFWLCIKLLLTAYATAMVVGVFSSNMYRKLITVLGHGLLASILWFHAQTLDIRNKTSITSFYMFIWKLFYAEYFLIPFVQ